MKRGHRDRSGFICFMCADLHTRSIGACETHRPVTRRKRHWRDPGTRACKPYGADSSWLRLGSDACMPQITDSPAPGHYAAFA
jgi:hypothetical protein